MASPEPGKQRCAVHPERTSVDRCQSCGRPSCLVCAVPFRGRVLCRTCASNALGTPYPEEPAAGSSPRPDLGVAAILGVGLVATIPPWHRSGTLSGAFAAWRPGAELPVFLAVVALGMGLGLVAIAGLLGWSGRPLMTTLLGLSVLATLATAFSILRAPDFYAFTPAPFVSLGASVAGAVVCLVRLRRSAPRPARAPP